MKSQIPNPCLVGKQVKSKYQRGVTLLEVLMVVVIIAIAVGIVLSSFSTLNQVQAVDKSAELVTSILKEARSRTLSSENASRYGVHMGTDEVVLFIGSTYTAGAPSNVAYNLNTLTEVDEVNLAGGGLEVVFDRLTGATSQSGTIVIILGSNASTSKTINISATGIAEVER